MQKNGFLDRSVKVKSIPEAQMTLVPSLRKCTVADPHSACRTAAGLLNPSTLWAALDHTLRFCLTRFVLKVIGSVLLLPVYVIQRALACGCTSQVSYTTSRRNFDYIRLWGKMV